MMLSNRTLFGNGLCVGAHFGGFLASYLFGLGLLGHFLETIDTAGRIDNLFLAGVEWMTESANFGMHRLNRRTGFEDSATSTRDSGFGIVCWMDA